MLVRGFGGGYCNWGGPFEGGGWFFGGIMPLLFWGSIITIFILVIRALIKKDKTQPVDNALEIVRKRFANGEIAEQEFEELTARLS